MLTLDISGTDVEVAGNSEKERVDPSEHGVDGTVVVVAMFPAFDNACVVTMDNDLSSNVSHRSDGMHEGLKSD